MALTSVKVSFNVKDGIGRISRQRLNTPYPVGDDFTTVLANAAAYYDALVPLVAGNVYSYDIQIPVGVTPTIPDPLVERGTKTVIVGQESVGNLRYFISTIPAVLVNDTLYDSDQHYLATASEWTAFETAYGALASSPEGNALTFRDAYLATRRK